MALMIDLHKINCNTVVYDPCLKVACQIEFTIFSNTISHRQFYKMKLCTNLTEWVITMKLLLFITYGGAIKILKEIS